jgi:hypothetical protein
MRFLIRFVLGLYPPWWRKRYGKETQELTEELLADPETKKWQTLGSLLIGAMTAWSQVKRRAAYLQPVSASGPSMDPVHFQSNPKGSGRSIAIWVVVGLACVVLMGVGSWFFVNRFYAAVKSAGPAIGDAMTQGAAATALTADDTARANHVPDGALTLSLLNQQHLDVDWLPGNASVPTSGNKTFVSITVGDSHVVTAASIIGCEYGLTVSSADDPIIGQDHLPGVGTYWAVLGDYSQPRPICSADSAPSVGWKRASPEAMNGMVAPST